VGLDVFGDLVGVEDVLGSQTGHVIVFDDIGLVELKSVDVVLLHVAVLLGFLEFLQRFDDVGEHLDFLLL
jgi:hypothetical protein